MTVTIERSHWATANLGDVIDLFDHKRIPLNSRERQARQGQYPYYGAQGVIDRIDGYVFDGRYILVAEDGENLNSKKLPLALFADGKFWVNNHAHILRAKPDVADDTFLLACLNNANIKPFVTGAAQPKLSQANLRLIEIPLPPLPIQRRIAGILSAYDELIENNQRRIRILEDMARSLYREWFVHFRYPGHESVPFVDSPLGQIPQGWEVKKIAELLAKVSRQEKIKTRDYLQTGDLPVIDQGRGLVGGYTNDADVEYLGELPVIVFGDHTRILKFIDFPFACGADGTQLLRSNDERMPVGLFYYMLSAIELSDFAYARHFKFLKEELVVVPTAEVATAFSERIDPIKRQVRILQQQSDNLRRTRDLLLPRLLSGQVNLAEA